MKTILKIAKAELRMLFCSPISWFLLIVFIVQLSMIFTGLYSEFVHTIEWGSGVQYAASFRFIMAMWNSVAGSLYYYIPLLTMSLISKDMSSGSIKLLYSSPITNSQIVLGKFLSTIAFAFSISLLMSLYMIVAAFTIVNFELGAALCGLLGVFLLACTYIAIGIFMSSLTSYQFVAAIGTFVILMLLSVIGGMWQEFDVVRDITYWLSINGRVFTFIRGMLCSEDLLYFIFVTAMFLALTILRLNSIRHRISKKSNFGRYFLVVLATCIIAYFSSRPMLICYYDATKTKQNTLTQQSQDVVKQLHGKLKITGYANLLYNRYSDVGFPHFIHTNRETFKLYERFKPDTKLKMVYYYDSISPVDRASGYVGFAQMLENDPGLTLKERMEKLAKHYRVSPKMFKSPEYLAEKGIDLTGERTMVWKLELNDKSVYLHIYPEDLSSIYPNEAEISAALRGLATKMHKIAIVKGHGMRGFSDNSIRDYYHGMANKETRYSLVNQGFDPVEIAISGGVPKDVDVLMIADMYEPFNDVEYEALKEYVNRGGNLFILGEQYRREVMNPMLEELFGVRLMDGTLVQNRWDDLAPDVLVSNVTEPAKALSYRFGEVKSVTMPSASGLQQLSDKGFEYIPIYVTDTIDADISEIERENNPFAVWNELESLDADLASLECNPEIGEKIDSYCTVAALWRKVGEKEQRIVIAGDADCLSSNELRQQRSSANLFFAMAVMHYLSDNEMPFDTRRPPLIDTKVEITKEGNKMIYRFFMIILPLLFLGTALFIWLRRRSR